MQIPTPYYDEWDDLYALIRDILTAALPGVFVYSALKVANGLMLGARVQALEEFGDAYTPEEREVLIHKIKQESKGFSVNDSALPRRSTQR